MSLPALRRKLIDAFRKVSKRPSQIELVASLARSPITAESSWKSQAPIFVLLGSLLPFFQLCLVGLVWLISDYSVLWTALFGTITIFGSFFWLYAFLIYSQRGYRVVADHERLTLYKFSSVIWSCEWNTLRIVDNQLFGVRKHVVLPDGRIGVWPLFLEYGSGHCEDIRRVTSQYVVPPEVRKPNIAVTLVIFMTATAVTVWTAGKFSPAPGGLGDPERDVPFGANDIVTIVALTISLSVAFVFGIRLLIHAKRKKPRSGATLAAFLSSSATPLPPIDLQAGVKYGYVDPKALRETFRLSLINFVGALIPIMFLLMPLFEPSSVSALTSVSWFAAVLLLVFFGVRRFRYESGFLQYFDDQLWLEEGNLHVKRGDREFILHSRPSLTSSRSWETKSPIFMSWHEHYANDEFEYLLDRRFLVPVSDC